MSPTVFWPLLLGVLGALVGSFVATLAIRWPAGRSVMYGRSACDGCGRVLGVGDLVPIVSFAWRRGRCTTCAAPIDPSHLVIELIAVAIGVAAGWAAPGVDAAAGAAFGWLLLALGALDLGALWLPDRLTLPLAALGVTGGIAGLDPPMPDRLIGGAAGYLSLWLIAAAYRRVRGRVGLGGGDAKLLGAIGLWLGWRPLPAVLFVACLVGLGVVGWRIATRRSVEGGDVMPLGTLLAVAAYPAWLLMIGTGG